MQINFESYWLCIMHFLIFFNQRTPLHVAASKGRDYTVERLVKKEANISIKDMDGVNIAILNYGR